MTAYKEYKIFNFLLEECIKEKETAKFFKKDLNDIFYETKKLVKNNKFLNVKADHYPLVIYLYNMHSDYFKDKKKPDSHFYKKLKIWLKKDYAVNAFDRLMAR